MNRPAPCGNLVPGERRGALGRYLLGLLLALRWRCCLCGLPADELVAEHRRAGTGVVSLQVLQEYFVTETSKLGGDARIVRRKVELLAEFDVAAPDVTDILAVIGAAW
jgi:hypothetical protein